MTAFLRRLWRGFVRLFGLDTCPVPPQVHAPTPAERATRARLQRLLHGNRRHQG